MTLSKTTFVAAGKAKPTTRLIMMRRKPSARMPLRGLSSAQASGKDFHASFFFSSFLPAFTSGSSAMARLEVLLSRDLFDVSSLHFTTFGGRVLTELEADRLSAWGKTFKHPVFVRAARCSRGVPMPTMARIAFAVL